MKKKILLIHSGGTIGMTRDGQDGVLRPDRFYASLLKVIPEISTIADIEVEIPFVLDSAELNFQHWQKLAAIVKDHLPESDGVVITHGTDTLAYTASALSYMLQNIPIPVILTGAQRPMDELRSDARNNLINAVELATADIPEVAVFFDYKLMRGNRTSKNHVNFFDAFVSRNYPLLAEVGVNIEIYRANLLHPGGPFQVRERFDNSLAVLKLFPGCNSDYFQPGPAIRAILLIAFGAGTIPLQSGNLPVRIAEWLAAGKAVVLASEARGGKIEPRLYESGQRLLAMGVVSAGDMTFEATATKLMFLLGQHDRTEALLNDFQRSLAGEMTVLQ
ncbi:MAG: asparaginase [Candidatus Aminicenantes bacterium]|nr:asparaginase [Candidatus Aminicenantes bacterium]